MNRFYLFLLLLLLPLSGVAQKRGKTPARPKKSAVETPAEPLLTPREEAMIDGLDRVVVFDSVVVRRADLLTAYPLSVSAGVLRWKNADCTDTEYLGSYGDVMYAGLEGDSTYHSILCSMVRFGDRWSEPEVVCTTPDAVHPNQSFPFLLSDGVTLYFAQEDPEGLGGLDIYMTRRGGESNTFFAPENLGFPFNSTANDYLLAIDEESGIGMFASDRRQPADSVCVYYFRPSDVRETWSEDDATLKERVGIAHLDSISATWRNITVEEVNDLRQRLANHRQRLSVTPDEATTQKLESRRALSELEETLQRLRSEWHRHYQAGVPLNKSQQAQRELILELEERVRQQRAALHVK